MLTNAGLVPATSSRPNHEGRRGVAEPSAEERIRYAHTLLASWGANLSHSRVARLCRDYERTGGRIAFEVYLLNNADISELQRIGLRNAFGAADPTGQIATANVNREDPDGEKARSRRGAR